MNFIPKKKEAINKLDYFIEKNLKDYSKLRNFDFGPDKREKTSCLSPYITHGVINELEIINKSLKKFSFVKNEKFILEVLWRIYWKGWLELRPTVWSEFLKELQKLKRNFQENKKYIDAINGKTNIECFNHWVEELKNFNYLHNHTRMWFASIWIFTLNLPWQLGAEFFMKHLFDGDSASNTLGWRWVAGIQTKGKHYLASEWNIRKFSNNRFNKIKLNENAESKFDEKNYKILNKNFKNKPITEKKILLIFENNLNFENSDFKNEKFKKILLVSNENDTRNIKLSRKNLDFKNLLMDDQKKRLDEKSIYCEKINITEIKYINESMFALYPSIGENLDYINSQKLTNIEYLYRKVDQFSWKYCNKGFFNFKNYIPKIIKEFI